MKSSTNVDIMVQILLCTWELMHRHKRIKRWWRDVGIGAINFVVRYGSRVLELDKGKAAIRIKHLKFLRLKSVSN